MAFSKVDSRSLENTYQRLLEETESNRRKGGHARTRSSSNRSRGVSAESPPNTGFDRDTNDLPPGSRVPVNEDFLFDVNIEHRELAPVYWLGPIYEVRRGTWFCTHSYIDSFFFFKSVLPDFSTAFRSYSYIRCKRYYLTPVSHRSRRVIIEALRGEPGSAIRGRLS